MVRGVIPIMLLLASVGDPAAAMEETNCLMACDAKAGY
jgi:hypothetical protein